LTAAERAGVLEQAIQLAGRGLRVLGVAGAVIPGGALPEDPAQIPLVFIGLIGFKDPLRSSAAPAIAEARAAGIKVAMLTGDHPATARAIAAEAGLDLSSPVLTGAALAATSDADLPAVVGRARVFARVMPEQKLRIVAALKLQGEVVAMTGDGVNDAPALRAAHIGIAMGKRGTDVAREAAGIVVLDDDLASIVAGVRTGRRIFDNLRKVSAYIIAIHVALAGLALLPLLLGLPPLLLPAHVVLTEMAIDPACSIAFEAARAETDSMTRPPRSPAESLVRWDRILSASLQGALVLAVSLGIYWGALRGGQGEAAARAESFTAFTAGNLALMASNLSTRPIWRQLAGADMAPFRWIAAAVTVVLAAGLYWPPAAELFSFERPSLAALGVALAGALLTFFVFEVAKAARSPALMALWLLPVLALGTAAPAIADSPAPRPAATARAAPDADVARLMASLDLREAPQPVRERKGWRKPRRIVVRRFRADAVEWLQPVAPGVELVAADTDAQAAAEAVHADAIIGFCEAGMIESARALKWVQSFAAGVERCIGTPAIAARGILVTNMQRVSGPVMAEHVLALLLGLARQLPVLITQQREHRWDEAIGDSGTMRVLEGKTLLVYGLGGIGTEVARRAHALGMRVTAIRASGRTGPDFVSYVGLPDELPRLAREADAIVNAAPLTPATTHLFDARIFAVMKPTAYFINVGRGASVVTADLVAALDSGRIGGAGLDVTDPEPLPAGHPLWRARNVIISPHVSNSSDSGNEARYLIARENLRRYVAGERMLSVVEPGRGY
jgi:phosphoglycerate dehydrogenase-like enzyme/phosphoserine phosphatase